MKAIVSIWAMVLMVSTAPMLVHATEGTKTVTEEVVEAAKETKMASSISNIEGTASQEPTNEEWATFMAAIGGAKGAGTMGLIVVIIQGLLLLARSQFGKLAGKWRLAVVYLLTLVVGILSLKVSGLDWFSAFTHSNSLAAFQVFLHQAKKQFLEKGADKAAA